MGMYTTKQLAKEKGYANNAVIRKMIADGKIKAKKIGRDWIISDLEAMKVERVRNPK